jgi:alkylhydroperoxidase/carboxymuconolactone decarboxylase family protein YurZ
MGYGISEKSFDLSERYRMKIEQFLNSYYFTISRFFHRKFLPWHLRHLVAVAALVAPQSLHIFLYSLAFCAIVFFTGSSMGIIVVFLFG